MYAINYGDESDHDLIYTEVLKEIHDRSQTHPTLIEENHVIKYVIILGKDKRNGNER